MSLLRCVSYQQVPCVQTLNVLCKEQFLPGFNLRWSRESQLLNSKTKCTVMYFRQLIILHQRQKIYFYMTVLKNLLKIYFLIPWNECLCIQASLEPVNLYNIIQVTLHQVCNPHDNLVSQHTKCGRSYQYMYMYLGINVMNQMNAFWPTSN